LNKRANKKILPQTFQFFRRRFLKKLIFFKPSTLKKTSSQNLINRNCFSVMMIEALLALFLREMTPESQTFFSKKF